MPSRAYWTAGGHHAGTFDEYLRPAVPGLRLGGLAAEGGDIALCHRRWFGAEARGDVIGDGGDFRIGQGRAERRHRDRTLWRGAPRAGDDDLRHVDGARVIDGARAGERGEGRN